MSETRDASVISVIVPTRDRPGQLARCLEALRNQTVVDSLEIVVVDDGSADPAALESAADHPKVRLVRQSRSGPSAARNRGVRAAHGAYVCFTDDDCEPQPDWAERLADRLQADASAVVGRTVNGSPGDPFAEASALIAAAPAVLGRDPARLSFGPSNNLGCRAEVLVALPFDEGFPGAAGEDRDWCARLITAGHVLASEPGAVVIHHQHLRFGNFWRKQIEYGRGAYLFRRRRGGAPLESPAFYGRLVSRGFQQGVRTGLLVTLAQLATAIGFIAEWRASRGAGVTVGVAA
jgi:glycosyltransferase involved in cell wall biosynthesis